MKIGIDALHVLPGSSRGIERVSRGLIQGLSRGEDRVAVYTGAEGTGEQGRFRERRMPLRSRSKAARLILQQAALGAAATRDGADVLLCPGNLCPAAGGPPRVLVIHDLAPLLFPDEFVALDRLAWRVLFPLCARAAARVITVSERTAVEVGRVLGVPREKLRVVYPGVDKAFLSGPPAAPEAGEILCVTKDAGYKNQDGLLQACKVLAGRGADFRLTVAGLAGPGRAAFAGAAAKLGLESRVRAAGTLSDEELAALYRRAALLVYPSRYEGFGLPVLEAMACGTPVAASRACAEAAGDAALLFSPDDPVETAEAMGRVLGDAGLAAGLRQKGRARAGMFTWERACREVRAVLSEAADRH